ncbi:MAG: hypothetical protein HWD61_01320 [Parachlamydiaceae bacterium]|nr:MAG: hypothetical protein HWD61_01320 [Parachlamydiaceae bacterium]
MLQESQRKVIRPHDFKMFLVTHSDHLKWLDDPNTDFNYQSSQQWISRFQGNVRNAEERKAYFMQSASLEECFDIPNRRFIAYSSVLKLIEAIGKERHIRKISIGVSYLRDYPQLLELLKIKGLFQTLINVGNLQDNYMFLSSIKPLPFG